MKEMAEVRTGEQLPKGVAKAEIAIALGKGSFGNPFRILGNDGEERRIE
jgi:hypothetical protein